MDQLIDAFAGKKVLIVGDVMVDAYIIGKVERLSPEAPVPVVNIEKYEWRLGGAANVALNITALRAEPILISVIGNDKESSDFLNLLDQNGLKKEGILLSKSRKTTTKTRILGNKHQMLRLDQETTSDLNAEENKNLIEAFKKQIDTCDVVILEDYNKGVLNEINIPILIDIAVKAGKPVAVDPKKKNFLMYKGVTLFKPNLKEIKEGLNSDADLKDKAALIQAVNVLNDELKNQYTMVTLSEDGVLITDHTSYEFIPAHLRNIADVSGAGDTVISVASLCLASGLDMHRMAELSNLAGGLVCEESGVIPIHLEKLKKESRYISSESH